MSDRFEIIKKKYISSFSDKKDEIKSAWANNEIAHVHDLLHKLAGSSGGYGFNDLYKLVLRGMDLTENTFNTNYDELNKCIEQICNKLKSLYETHFQEVEVGI